MDKFNVEQMTRYYCKIYFIKVIKIHKIHIFRGDSSNVAKRIIDCAKKNSIETIVRITADCPIIDPEIIDKCINLHLKQKKMHKCVW